ncbi:unnamed protein product [Sphagnum balticum]
MYEPSPLSQSRLSDPMTRSRKPHYTGSNPFQDDLADYEEKHLSQLNATKQLNSRAKSKQEKEAVSAKELKETRHGLNELSIEAESLKETLVETCALKGKLENQLLKASEEFKDNVPAVTQSLAANEEEVETLKQSLREESDNVMHLTDELAKVA